MVKYSNGTGTILKSYEYDAFGDEVNTSTTDANPFRYAGQYFDSETGTYYLRARYYSPALGRFTQQDAWGYGNPSDPLSLNLYVYCYGNPVAFIDFNGHWPSWSQIGSALLIAAVATVSVAAIVATAGAAGAAIGTGIAMYLGASASTAITLSTIATVGAYGVAAGVGAVAVNDIGEVLTGHNVIRDDLLGGNQAAYDDTRLLLSMTGSGLVAIGSTYITPATPSSGKNRPLQTHHFASNKNSTYTKQFEKITSKYGLDLDGDWNKAIMPHQGRHPNAYHQYVLDSMIKFDQIARGNTPIFLDLFESLKKTIMDNPEMLRKSYWEN